MGLYPQPHKLAANTHHVLNSTVIQLNQMVHDLRKSAPHKAAASSRVRKPKGVKKSKSVKKPSVVYSDGCGGGTSQDDYRIFATIEFKTHRATCLESAPLLQDDSKDKVTDISITTLWLSLWALLLYAFSSAIRTLQETANPRKIVTFSDC